MARRKYKPLAERVLGVIEEHSGDLLPARDLMCGVLQSFSIEGEIEDDDGRKFVFDDHSGLVIFEEGNAALAEYEVVITIDDDDDEDEAEEEDC